MRNELARRDDGRDSTVEVPEISNFEFQISNSKFGISRVSRGFVARLFLWRSRLEIPLCYAVEADLSEQGGTHASQGGILLIGFDEIAETRHGIVPKTALGIPQDALPVAAQIDFHFHEARTELTALDNAAGHNILRW